MQAKENDRQRGYGKVWDMVLSDYGKGGIDWKCVDGLLYGLGEEHSERKNDCVWTNIKFIDF